MASGRIDQALVFTRTKHGANRLAEQLVKDGILAAAIHGNRSQSQRVRALTDFKAGRVTILVATEVAARGLDIEQLPHVVNYELPMVPSDYLHRIGRTGRAGIEGDAISLVCVDETRLLRDIETLLGHKIDVEIIPGYEPDRSIRPEPIRLRTMGGQVAPAGFGGSRRPGFGRPQGPPARPPFAGRPGGGHAGPGHAAPAHANPAHAQNGHPSGRAGFARPAPASGPCPGNASLIAVTAGRLRRVVPAGGRPGPMNRQGQAPHQGPAGRQGSPGRPVQGGRPAQGGYPTGGYPVGGSGGHQPSGRPAAGHPSAGRPGPDRRPAAPRGGRW